MRQRGNRLRGALLSGNGIPAAAGHYTWLLSSVSLALTQVLARGGQLFYNFCWALIPHNGRTTSATIKLSAFCHLLNEPFRFSSFQPRQPVPLCWPAFTCRRGAPNDWSAFAAANRAAAAVAVNGSQQVFAVPNLSARRNAADGDESWRLLVVLWPPKAKKSTRGERRSRGKAAFLHEPQMSHRLWRRGGNESEPAGYCCSISGPTGRPTLCGKHWATNRRVL